MNRFIVIGAENNGGVRNYILYIARNLVDCSFTILSNGNSDCPALQNVSYVEIDPNRFNIIRNVLRLIKKNKYRIIANTISGGFIALILKRCFSLEYYYIGHTIRSLQINKHSFKYFTIKFVEMCVFNSSVKNIAICMGEYDFLNTKAMNNVLIPTRFHYDLKIIENRSSWSDKKVFFNVASVDERKDPYLFLNLAKLFKHNSDVFFVWIGDGPLLKLISDKVKKENMHNVFFVGKVEHNEILQIIPTFYCMLMTSRTEGVPVSIIESLELDVPVITYNYEGCSPGALVKDKFNGFIFNEVEEARKCISTMLDINYYENIKNNIKSERESRFQESINFLNSYKQILNYE